MNAPDPPVIQPDPLMQQQEQQAQTDNVLALQQRARDDSASMMARYGALAGYVGAKT